MSDIISRKSRVRVALAASLSAVRKAQAEDDERMRRVYRRIAYTYQRYAEKIGNGG